MAGNDDEATPQGWYRQKDDPHILRWWDGHGWSEETMPTPDDAAPAVPASARPTIRIHDDDTAGAPPRRTQPLQPPDRPQRPPRSAARTGGPRPATGDGRHRQEVRTGRDPAEAARLVARVVGVVAVLLVLLVASIKLRDASPGNARTLTAVAAPIAKDSPTATPFAKVALTLSDLPAGWATQAYNANADDICLGRVPRSVLVPLQIQTAGFTKGTTGPFITSVVMRFASEDVAKHFMTLIADTVESCRSYVSNGSVLKLGPSSFPKLGDDTYATKASGSSAYGALDGNIVYIRHGDRVAAVETISFGSSTVSRDLVVFISRVLAHRL